MTEANVFVLLSIIFFFLIYVINNASKLYNNQTASLELLCLTQVILVMGNLLSRARG